ncbi:hypothetical protein Ciccas_011714 [Cichlidogyrus casuarinus]|uniref:Uncharacterized protein n=1 Tax=Cichlidogyrus casuarinus TaxID=1844966 RepID=A0ABD2PQF7_9PLAT
MENNLVDFSRVIKINFANYRPPQPTLPFVPMQQPPPLPLPPGPSVPIKLVKKITRPAPGANGLPVELVHPDEDLPLEELRLKSQRYKYVTDLMTTKNLHASNVPPPTLASIPMSMPPMMPPMLGVSAPPVMPGAMPPFHHWPPGHRPPLGF